MRAPIRLLIILVLVTFPCFSVAVPIAAASDLEVQTQNGAVAGMLLGSMKAWEGIPYAAPPIGDLRWRPPAPVTPWAGVRDATQPGPPCIQLGFEEGTVGSEDCLYLNVFAPPTASPTSGLAVMVHLHPGSNTFGEPYMEASAFVARDVIVVTIAYRLGVFGFVGHPALSAEGGGSSGEYGVLDQLAALRWVRDNIEAFGGDPSRVMLFGSSAGSFDTVAIMASPLSQGLIARASVQGEYFTGLTGAFNTIADAENIGVAAANDVGCGSVEQVLQCLRATPADALVEAAGFLDILPWVGGAVLPKSPLELVTEGAGVPLLIGFDREEDAVFTIPFPYSYTTRHWVRDTNLLIGPPRAELARTLYPEEEYDSLGWAFTTMLTDAKRGCPTRRLANAVAVNTPTWRWLYAHTYENDPFFAQFRASHVLEEPFLWGNFDLFGFAYSPSPAEEVLSAHMTDYWTNFAKSGDPNGPGLPAWPSYETATEPILTLDNEIGVQTSYHVEECGFLDTIPTPFAFPFDWRGYLQPPSPFLSN